MRRLLLTACLLLSVAQADTGIKVTCDTLWVRVFAGAETTLAGVRVCGDSWAVPPKWWVMYYADSVAGGGGGGTTDTLAFHHGSLRDTSETLFARAVYVDTTAGPAALNVAGNVWVRDTTTTDFLFVNALSNDSAVPFGGFCLGTNNARPAYWSFLWGDNSAAGNFGDIVMGTACSTKMNMLEGDYSIVMGHGSKAKIGYSIAIGNSNVATDSAPTGTVIGGSSNSLHAGVSAIFNGVSCAVSAKGATLIGGANDVMPASDSNKIRLGYPTIVDDSLRCPIISADTFRGDGSLLTGIAVPGQIIDWYGDSSAFPTGYVLCDGTRKFKNAAGDSVLTPDLRNFFTVGASIDTGNGIPMSSIEDTTGAAAKATGGSVKYTPAGAVSVLSPHSLAATCPSDGERYCADANELTHDPQTFTGTRAVLVQPYVAVWKLIRSRTY